MLRVRLACGISAISLALAGPAAALDLSGSSTPGRIPGDGVMPNLTDREIAINRADKRLIFKNVDGTLGYGSLLNASPAGRKAVEQGDASGLTGVTAARLDARATASVNISPFFCPYGQLNGIDSNNACVQKAVDYTCSLLTSTNGTRVGGKLNFGTAQYRLTHVVVPSSCGGLFFKGQGNGGTGGTIIYSDNGCTGPIIDFYPDATANYIKGGGVSDIHFFNNKSPGGLFDRSTSCLQPLIQVSYGRDMVFKDNSSLSPFVMYRLKSGLNFTIDGVPIDAALPNSPGVFDFFGSGATVDGGALTRQDVIDVSHVNFFSITPPTGEQYARGIWWHGFSASLRTNNTAFTTASTALKVDCTNPVVPANQRSTEIGACPGFAIFNDFETEAAGANAIDITDAQSLQFNFLYAACYPRTSTSTPHKSGCNTAMSVKNTQFLATGGITVNGGILNGAQANGIDFEGYQFTLTGGTKVYGNDAAGVGASNIRIQPPVAGAASGSHVITNNTICGGTSANFDGKTALSVGAGNDFIVYANNVLRGCGADISGSVGAKGVLGPNAGP